jgi:dTDP-4-dehydrorhamnose 3,5-epimerase
VAYLCSEEYNPEKAEESLPLRRRDRVDGFSLGECSLSAKDDAAPTLAEAAAAGILPDYEVCRSFRAGLK